MRLTAHAQKRNRMSLSPPKCARNDPSSAQYNTHPKNKKKKKSQKIKIKRNRRAQKRNRMKKTIHKPLIVRPTPKENQQKDITSPL